MARSLRVLLTCLPVLAFAQPNDTGYTVKIREYATEPYFLTELRPRGVLRFAAREKDLLVSGLLAGGRELAARPAILDVPKGKGHVLLFANNPIWRQQTQGSFFLLFNAMLHYDNLGAGRASAGDAAPSSGAQ